MAINDPWAPPQVRAPRLRVLTGGKEIPGAVMAEVANNGHYQPDRFRVQFAANASGAKDLRWWGDQGPILLDVQFGFEGSEQGWKSLIVGEIDHLEVEPATGTVRAEGRDLTARLAESKTQEALQNKTASEIATILAQRHNLTPDVTATKTLVGRYYAKDHTHVALNEFGNTTTEWDLLCWLAQQEGFDAWVDPYMPDGSRAQGDSVLHFKAPTEPDADPWLVVWEPPEGGLPRSNAMNLRLERALTLAKDVRVVVRSWRSSEGRGFEKVFPLGVSPSKVRSGKAVQYVFVRPNMTEAQAQAFAQKMHEEITKHERVISWCEPGDLRLSPRSMVRLQGTGSSWDQVYYVTEITRRISFQDGFVMDVRARNKSAATDAATGSAAL